MIIADTTPAGVRIAIRIATPILMNDAMKWYEVQYAAERYPMRKPCGVVHIRLDHEVIVDDQRVVYGWDGSARAVLWRWAD